MNDYVFLITEQVEEDAEEFSRDVFEFNTLDDVNFKLDELTFGEVDSTDLLVYQGVLIPAIYIPDKLNGLIPYIYIKNPERANDPTFKDDAVFIKASKNINKTTSIIEELLKNAYLFLNINESFVSIEDVYLFFGEELLLSLQIIDSNIDEEVLSRAMALKKSINNFTIPNNVKELENYE